MFDKLFRRSKEKPDLDQFFRSDGDTASIVILSGLCCNPMAYGIEERLLESVRATLTSLGITAEIRTLSITEAQKEMSTLSACHPALVQDIQSIFQSHGLKAFPALVINGSLAFYSGVPAADLLAGELRKHLGLRE